MTIFKSIGIVFSLLLVIALTFVSLYASYLLSIGAIIIALTYIVYKILQFLKVVKYDL